MDPFKSLTGNECLLAQAIGQMIVRLFRWTGDPDFTEMVDSEAVQLLKEIKAILADKEIDDPTCFEQIDAILHVLYLHGIPVDRHSEYK